MNLTFAALEPEYTHRLAAMKLLSVPAATKIAVAILPFKQRFLDVSTATGVPALWLMATWDREAPAINRFDCYFGNGDPLDRPTTDVPQDRGPFTGTDAWEKGCIDALHIDEVSSETQWSLVRMCWHWEKWNGFGPREHGRPSGYLWAGTDQYRGGKYVADGVWSPRTWDKQLGCVIIAKELVALDASLGGPF